MSGYLKKFEFETEPQKIEYNEGEPLKLNEKFKFYHNKIKFRRELNDLQFLFQDYFDSSLQAAGIRDSYLKLEYTESYLMVIFTDPENIKNTNEIIESYLEIDIDKGCYFIGSTSNYLILLTKDIKGVSAGVKKLHEILDQILHEYFQRKEFDKFVQIRPFKIYSCD